MPRMSSDPLGPIASGKQPDLPVGTPYCSACGYDLSATTETPRCPECGRPLIDVLARVRATTMPGVRTRRYTSAATVFGMPLISIATGPRPDAGEPFGRAKGFIAIGDTATGVIALGGRACGIVSFGGLSVGVISAGGCSLGGLLSAGGCAIAFPGVASGGLAVGGVAVGGMGIGFIAQGGMAVGYFARGGGAFGRYIISRGRADPEAVQVFDSLSWLMPMGSGPVTAYTGLLLLFAAAILIALLLFAIGMIFKKEPADQPF